MVTSQACVHGGVAPDVRDFWIGGTGPGEETRPAATRRSDGAEGSAADLTLLLLGASKLVFFWILSCSLSM